MGTNRILPFKFWCQKVLPLIYDDSLSYYEVLCKVTAKLNEVINSDNEQSEAIENLQKAVQEIIESESSVAEDIEELKRRMGSAEDDILGIANAVEGLSNALTNLDNNLLLACRNFAPEYAEDSSYNAGEYCFYNYRFYRCIEDTPLPCGEFDPEKWLATSTSTELIRLWDECANIRSAFNDLTITLENAFDEFKDDVMENIAPAFTNYSGTPIAYESGALVIDETDNNLYKCIMSYVISEVVATPHNDATHWEVTNLASNITDGGGGTSGVTVEEYDETKSYLCFEMVVYNDIIYVCTKQYAGEEPFNYNDWIPTNPVNEITSSRRIEQDYAPEIDENNQFPYSAGDIVSYRNNSGVCTLMRAKRDNATDPTYIGDFEDTSLVLEILINRRLAGTGDETFDPTKVYNKGDIVIHNGSFCVCKNDNTTGTYHAGDWTYGSNMFKELATLISKVNTLSVYQNDIRDRLSDNVREAV